MKFVSFKHNNVEKFGIIENNLITDLTGKIGGASNLKELIKIKKIKEAKRICNKNLGSIKTDEIEYSPLDPNPGKIICVGLNYIDKEKPIVQLKKTQLYFIDFQKVKQLICRQSKDHQYPKV